MYLQIINAAELVILFVLGLAIVHNRTVIHSLRHQLKTAMVILESLEELGLRKRE